jgi:hypothetical protein
MEPQDGAFDSPIEKVTATIDVSGWTPGSYALYVHGKDEAGNWGKYASVVLVVPPPIIQLTFVAPEQTIEVGQVSAPLTLQVQDADGAPVAVMEDTAVALTTTSQTGEFSEMIDPWVPVAKVAILAGNNKVSFYYKDETPGEYTITAAEAPDKGWEDATQRITVVKDSTPPGRITDLEAVSPTLNSITITWTAPGDDRDKGQAAKYDIRYSEQVITDETWGDAEKVVDPPRPKEAGSSEKFVVSGLSSGKTYYFGIKTQDEAGNESELSNIPSLMTARQTKLALYPGWNLVSLPLKPTEPLTAEGFGQLINEQNGYCTIIQAWDGSGWTTHEIGMPFGDFPIEVGCGYFVYCEIESVVEIVGVEVHTLSLQLNIAWNLIGFPIDVVYLIGTAKDLVSGINEQGGEAERIQGWDAGLWKTYLGGMPFGNFPIELGKGYFVHCKRNSIYSPNE